MNLLANVVAKAAIKVAFKKISKKALIIGAGTVGTAAVGGGTAGLIIHHNSKKAEALLADESLAEEKGAEKVEAEATVVETTGDKKAELPKLEATTEVAAQKDAQIINIAPGTADIRNVTPEQFNKQAEALLNATPNGTPAPEVKSEIPAHQDMGNNSYQLPWNRPDYFQPNPVYEFAAQNGIKLPEQVVQKIEENNQNNTQVPPQVPNYFGVGAPTNFYAGPIVKAPMSQFDPNIKKDTVEVNSEPEAPKVAEIAEQPEVKEAVEQLKEDLNTPKTKVNSKKKASTKKKK